MQGKNGGSKRGWGQLKTDSIALETSKSAAAKEARPITMNTCNGRRA